MICASVLHPVNARFGREESCMASEDKCSVGAKFGHFVLLPDVRELLTVVFDYCKFLLISPPESPTLLYSLLLPFAAGLRS